MKVNIEDTITIEDVGDNKDFVKLTVTAVDDNGLMQEVEVAINPKELIDALFMFIPDAT